MIRRFDRYDLLSICGIAAMFAAAIWARENISGRIPIHFDIHGRANGWASGPFGVFVLPGVTLLLFLWLRLGARLLSASWRERMEASPISLLTLMLTLLFGAIEGATLVAARHPGTSVAVPMAMAINAFSVALGLLYPKLRRNPWMGVRNAWTLSSDENWARTHRFGGLCAVVGGVIGIAVAQLSVELSFIACMLGLLAPLPYSFLLARRLQ